MKYRTEQRHVDGVKRAVSQFKIPISEQDVVDILRSYLAGSGFVIAPRAATDEMLSAAEAYGSKTIGPLSIDQAYDALLSGFAPPRVLRCL